LFEEDFGARRSSDREGAFIGDDSERSTRFNEVSFYGESTPNKQFFLSAFASYKRGEFDLDYDAGPRFLRASPAALLDPDALLDPNPGSLFYFESSLSYRPATAFKLLLITIKAGSNAAITSALLLTTMLLADVYLQFNKISFLQNRS
jgi:hypothetical protein